MVNISSRPHITSLKCFIGAFIIFFIFIAFQTYTNDFFKFGQESTLVYLPAGIAFICVLLGGFFGALGVCLVLVIFYSVQPYPSPFYLIVLLTAFSGMTQYVVIRGILFFLNIPPSLQSLKHSHLIVLAICFSLAHSICHHINLVVFTNNKLSWVESRIGLSAFLGVMVVLMFLWILSKIHMRIMRYE